MQETATITPDDSEPRPASPTPTDHPAKIGRFDIRRFLGEGAFGRVYEAFDPSLKRAVALKLAKAEQLAGENRLERFRREAPANLTHPNIVAVYDHGEDGGRHYIASAYIEGRTLEAELKRGEGKLPFRDAAAIARRLAEALAYAHRQGILHRDVKPANVMLSSVGQASSLPTSRQAGSLPYEQEPMLMDFGLPRASRRRRS